MTGRTVQCDAHTIAYRVSQGAAYITPLHDTSLLPVVLDDLAAFGVDFQVMHINDSRIVTLLGAPVGTDMWNADTDYETMMRDTAHWRAGP